MPNLITPNISRLTLFGYGKTTRAIARRFGNCDIFDDTFTEITMDEQGNRLMPIHLFDPQGSQLEVTSPGIAPSHPLIRSAQNLISEYDLFADTMPYSIWISGTNGKTTTTQMADYLLKKRGADTGGNIGKPLADMNQAANLWILETSSFTLHYTRRAKPGLYLLLPITPDHITWHGSMQQYETAKLKPLDSMQEGEAVIIPKRYENYASKAFKITYDGADDLARYLGIEIFKIRFRGVFLLDAVMALAASKVLFDEIDYDQINAFVIGEHRQEEFFDVQGRLWVDDSKATNLDAAIEAIKNYDNRPIHLILGGDTKGADLAELFDFIVPRDITVYAIGTSAAYIANECQKRQIPCLRCDTLKKAVDEISLRRSCLDVALLSPACASLDQFSSYAERGEKFKEYAQVVTH